MCTRREGAIAGMIFWFRGARSFDYCIAMPARKQKTPTGKVVPKAVGEAAPAAQSISFDCVTATQGTTKLIIFTASAKKLWSLVTINQRDPDKQKGYQRVLTPGRVGNIAQYVDRGSLIPNSILVSFEEGTLSNGDRTFTVSCKPDAGWIIDGQHRLAGIHEARRDVEVPVVAFVGLDVQQQIELFVKINKEAKNVPSSLYIDLLKYLPNKSDADLTKERAADLAENLRRDEQSPFFGRIAVLGSPKGGELSLTNFVRKIGPLVAKNRGKLNLYSVQSQLGILNNYYQALAHVFPSEYEPREGTSIFFKTVGFGAAINALPAVIDLCLTNHHGFKLENVISVLRAVGDFDFGQWDELGTGTEAENIAGELLTAALREKVQGASGDTGLDIPL